MPELEFLVKCGVYGLMGLAIIAAVGAVLLRNLFHAGLALVLVLVTIAGIFMSVGAEFLGMVQILLYVGGVMTLIIYTIMLTGRLGAKDATVQNRQGIFAAIAGGFFVCVIGRLILRPGAWPQRR